MREKVSNIVWGISLIVFSVILLGNLFAFWFIDIFSNGWWTLFILIPAIVMFMINKYSVGNLILMIVGLVLLIFCRGFFSLRYIIELLLSLVVLGIGVKLIIGNFCDKSKEESKISNQALVSYNGIFCSFDEKCLQENFKGARINSIFGSINLDLKDVKITKNVKINIFCLFGKVNIKVPNDINVEVSGNNIFSNIQNKVQKHNNRASIISINSTCLFGNLKIK